MMRPVARKKREPHNKERGQRFQVAREHARLSQPMAAQEFGVSPTTVYWWEKGANPTGVDPERVAERYGVRVAWLMYGDGAMLGEGHRAPRIDLPSVAEEPSPYAQPNDALGRQPEPRLERDDELAPSELQRMLDEHQATDEEAEQVRAAYMRDAWKGGWTRDRALGVLEGIRLVASGRPKLPERERATNEADAARDANLRKSVKRLGPKKRK